MNAKNHESHETDMESDKTSNKPVNRREFLRGGLRGAAFLALGGVAAVAVKRRVGIGDDHVWQLDPDKCIQCGRCATNCVLTPSAVKCVHAYDLCGYCRLCGGYHQPDAKATDTAAENRLCPVDAIRRTYIEDPYYEYEIDESLCIGCGKCVKGCGAFGNSSLHLQVRHDLCVNCNECSIAKNCPADAFVRVPASQPYLMRGKAGRGA